MSSPPDSPWAGLGIRATRAASNEVPRMGTVASSDTRRREGRGDAGDPQCGSSERSGERPAESFPLPSIRTSGGQIPRDPRNRRAPRSSLRVASGPRLPRRYADGHALARETSPQWDRSSASAGTPDRHGVRACLGDVPRLGQVVGEAADRGPRRAAKRIARERPWRAGRRIARERQ